ARRRQARRRGMHDPGGWPAPRRSGLPRRSGGYDGRRRFLRRRFPACLAGRPALARGAALGRGLRRSFHPRPGRHLPPGRCRRGRAADRVRLVITVGGFNTSVDKTLELDVLQPGAVHRVTRVQSWPGGKGLHVALTVAALGEPVHLVGLIDAAHRYEFESALRARGVAFTRVDADTREELCARFLALARESAVAVLSGSTPPGFHEGAYGELVASLRDTGIPCLVDASGGLLR